MATKHLLSNGFQETPHFVKRNGSSGVWGPTAFHIGSRRRGATAPAARCERSRSLQYGIVRKNNYYIFFLFFFFGGLRARLQGPPKRLPFIFFIKSFVFFFLFIFRILSKYSNYIFFRLARLSAKNSCLSAASRPRWSGHKYPGYLKLILISFSWRY